MKLGASRGLLVKVECGDLALGEQWDLRRSSNLEVLLAMAQSGAWNGFHSGPPCSTWSMARYANNIGPPPLRSRDLPWGLPNLAARHRLQVLEANQLMDASLTLLSAVARQGGSVSQEHPADPGQQPFPSIWATPRWKELKDELDLRESSFHQCRFGAGSRKPTTLGSNLEFLDAVDGMKCNHGGGHPRLLGLDRSGCFRTKGAQAYPSELCKLIAEAHLDKVNLETLEEEDVAEETLLAEELAEESEIGNALPVPPVALHWDPLHRWKELFRWKWQRDDHINVLEAKTACIAFCHRVRDARCWGKRIMLFTDSQVTLGCLTKGRSSIGSLNRVARRLGSLQLGFGIKPYFRWVPTKRNHADGPSRGFPLGIAPEAGEKESNHLREAFAARARMGAEMPEEFRRLPG